MMPNKKILLVNNIKAIVEKEKSLLARSDFTIFTATSGEEAIQIHDTEKVDLIIADMDMPAMGGDVLCSRIRRNGNLKNVSVLLVGPKGEADMMRFNACGANAYISKPLNLQKLFEKVGELLNISLRLSIRLLVKITLKGSFKGQSFFAESHNISQTGVLIETDKSLERGDIIACSFFLGTDQVSSDGEVVRIIKKPQNIRHYGIKFTNMDASSKAKIDDFVVRLLKR